MRSERWSAKASLSVRIRWSVKTPFTITDHLKESTRNHFDAINKHIWRFLMGHGSKQSKQERQKNADLRKELSHETNCHCTLSSEFVGGGEVRKMIEGYFSRFLPFKKDREEYTGRFVGLCFVVGLGSCWYPEHESFQILQTKSTHPPPALPSSASVNVTAEVRPASDTAMDRADPAAANEEDALL